MRMQSQDQSTSRRRFLRVGVAGIGAGILAGESRALGRRMDSQSGTSAAAPDLSVEWDRTLGQCELNEANALVGVDGGFVFAGESGGRAWLVALDSDGTVRWERRFSDLGPAHSLVRRPDGGYALAGDEYVAELTADCEYRWVRRYETPHELRVLTQTGDGQLVAAGQVGGAWISKLGRCGETLWEYRIADAPPNDESEYDRRYRFDAIAGTDEGGAVAAGTVERRSEGDLFADALFARVDVSGAPHWRRFIDLGPYTEMSTVIRRSDGGYAAAGFEHAAGQAFVAELTASGEFTRLGWYESREPTSEPREPTALTERPNSGYALALGRHSTAILSIGSDGGTVDTLRLDGPGEVNRINSMIANGDIYTFVGFAGSRDSESGSAWVGRFGVDEPTSTVRGARLSRSRGK